MEVVAADSLMPSKVDEAVVAVSAAEAEAGAVVVSLTPSKAGEVGAVAAKAVSLTLSKAEEAAVMAA